MIQKDNISIFLLPAGMKSVITIIVSKVISKLITKIDFM